MASRKPFSSLTRQGKRFRLRSADQTNLHTLQPSDSSESEEDSSRQNIDLSSENVQDHNTEQFPPAFSQSPTSYSSDSDDEPSESESFDLGLSSTLRDWALKYNITGVALTALLCILRTHKCFVKLPYDSRTVMKTPRSVVLKQVHPGHYCHIGIVKSLERLSTNIVETYVTGIELLVGIDGLSLFKSCCSEMWPIMGRVLNIPSLRSKVFPIGIYYGEKKPESSKEYLMSFVSEAAELIKNGIILNGKRFSFLIKGICCDAPAKAYVLGIKGHGGYRSCTRCKQKGVYYKNKITFCELHSDARTSNGFLMKEDPEFHMADSLLVEIPGLDFVYSFPLDYMHLICLGVIRTLLYTWVFEKPPLKMPWRVINSISMNLVALKSSIPLEFCRKPRLLNDIKRWKATEYRQFLLYTGPVVLHTALLPDFKPQYDNFLTLHVAISILLNPKLCYIHQSYAKELLEHFVKTFQVLYGKEFMTHNFHNLLHLSDDVTTFGNLDSCSAFPFENFLQLVKKLVRKNEYPLQQVVKRLEEASHLGLDDNDAGNVASYPHISKLHSDGPLFDGCNPSKQFKCATFSSFKLTTSQPNNCCSLNDGTIAVIYNICFSSTLDCMVILCKKYEKMENFYGTPLCPSSALGIYKVKKLSTLRAVPLSEVASKLVKLPFKTKNCDIVFPILHCEV